jgi:hypothetical protein
MTVEELYWALKQLRADGHGAKLFEVYCPQLAEENKEFVKLQLPTLEAMREHVYITGIGEAL